MVNEDVSASGFLDGVDIVRRRSYFAGLLTTYNRLMASHLGYSIFGRALPALIFGLMLGAKSVALVDLLRNGGDPGSGLNHYAVVSYQTLVLLFLVSVCLLFVIRLPSSSGLSSVTDGVIAFGGTFISTPLAFAPITVANPVLLWLATAFMVLGSIFSLAALLRLGRCFGVSAQARGLVTTGPYRWIRHPLYVSEELTTLGVLIPVAAWGTVAVFLAHCLLQFLRARREEAVLERAFPRYGAYKQSVARFIPGIY